MSSSEDSTNTIIEKRKQSNLPENTTKKLRQESVSQIPQTLTSEDVKTALKYNPENLAVTTNELLKKYENMSSSDLEAICERVLIYDKSGIYISPEDFKLNCRSKKNKQKSVKPKAHDPKEAKPQFGQGRVGVCCEKFGHKVCTCCNNDYVGDPKLERNQQIPNVYLKVDHEAPRNLSKPKIEPEIANSLPINQDVSTDHTYMRLQNSQMSKPNFMIKTEQETATDLSKPSCSGLQRGRERLLQEPNVSSTGDIMDFVNSLNFQMDNEIETAQETFQLSDLDFTQLSSNLNSIFNESLGIVDPMEISTETINLAENDNSNIIDLTSTPNPPRAIPNNLGIINLVDDSPIARNVRPGPVEVIDLVDSESDSETTSSKPIEINTSNSKPVLECPICLESLKNKKMMSTICGHIFCSRCIRNVVRKTKSCPNCRKKLNVKNIHPIYFNL